MNNLDKIFKDKLYDLETNLGGEVSFEKVMSKRKKSGIPVWWKPAVFVLATLSVVSITGFFIHDGSSSAGDELAHASVKSINSMERPVSPKSNKLADLSKTSDKAVLSPVEDPSQPKFQFPITSDKKRKGMKNSTNASAITTEKTIFVADVAAVRNTFASQLKAFGLRIFDSKNTLGAAPSVAGLAYPDVSVPKTMLIPDLEFMINTGGSNSGFVGGSAYSVRGNHYFGQYSGVALWNVKYGIQLGAGIGFSQFMGNGEWRSLNAYDKQQIDTQYITIIQPGLPNKVITVYDTSVVNVKEITSGNLNYRLSKLSLPLALRYHMGEGRTILRFSGTVAPGILTSSNGELFNKKSSSNVDGQNQNQFTLDAKFGVGLHYMLTRNVAVIAEPGLVYQSISGQNWNAYNRVSLGFGLGLVIKP